MLRVKKEDGEGRALSEEKYVSDSPTAPSAPLWEPARTPWRVYLTWLLLVLAVLLLVLLSPILLLALLGKWCCSCCRKRKAAVAPEPPQALCKALPEAPQYLSEARCPVAHWAPGFTPAIAAIAEQETQNYSAKFAQKGHAPSLDHNDHNYGTNLGQGNTLGFLAGHLIVEEAGLSELAPRQRVGLFAKSGVYPAVARLSDFGADDPAEQIGGLKLGRMALKLPWAEAWQEEINLTFTSDQSFFTSSSWKSVVAMFGGKEHWKANNYGSEPWRQLKILADLRYALLHLLHTLSSPRRNVLSRAYYSQLPYALGEAAVMRYRLKPLVTDVPLLRTKFAKLPVAEAVQSVADLVASKDVCFALQLQVREVGGAGNERVNRDAITPWNERYLTVAKLVFPKQQADDCMNAPLRGALCSAFGLDAASAASRALHKSFSFHPISTAAEHRPVGDINEYRCGFYARHMHTRLSTMQANTGIGVRTLPFSSIDPAIFGLRATHISPGA